MARQFSAPRLRRFLAESQRRPEAIALDVDRGIDAIRSYCSGRNIPPANIVAGLAEALGVGIDALYEEVDQ